MGIQHTAAPKIALGGILESQSLDRDRAKETLDYMGKLSWTDLLNSGPELGRDALNAEQKLAAQQQARKKPEEGRWAALSPESKTVMDRMDKFESKVGDFLKGLVLPKSWC
jgi:hypothetical protein